MPAGAASTNDDSLRGALRAVVRDHPLAFSVVLTFALADVGILIDRVRGGLAPGLTPTSAGILAETVAAALLVAVIAVLGWWQRVGFNGPSAWRGPFVMLAALAYAALPLGAGVDPIDARTLAIAVGVFVLIALTEEAAFRGVVLEALIPQGILRAVFTSSALFGALHLSRLFVGGDALSTTMLVLTAALAGVGHAAVRIRTATLWAPILAHAVYNVSVFLTPAQATQGPWALVIFAASIAYAAYGIVLLRDHWPSRIPPSHAP